MTTPSTQTNAFTMIELMVTVIIIGLIAVFGIPNYTKTINRAKEKDARINLELIREAVRLYMVREGSAPPALANVGAINTTLAINVMEQEGTTYICEVANTYRCRAINGSPVNWRLWFRLDTSDGDVKCCNTNPPCTPALSCPSIPNG